MDTASLWSDLNERNVSKYCKNFVSCITTDHNNDHNNGRVNLLGVGVSMNKYHRAIKLLTDMEWSGSHTDDENWAVFTRACPCCFNSMTDGHKCGCQLKELIS